MLVVLCFLVSIVAAASSRTFTVVNRCTIPIRVFFDNDDSGLLHTGRYLTESKPSNWSGEIYTNSVLNGSNAAGPGMTRAVFNVRWMSFTGWPNGWGNCWQEDIYYIIRDLGNDFNVGVTIAPFSAPVRYLTTLGLSSTNVLWRKADSVAPRLAPPTNAGMLSLTEHLPWPCQVSAINLPLLYHSTHVATTLLSE